jgi:hypothetical protein
MGRYTVELGASVEARLQLIMEASNAATGRADDLSSWLPYHLKVVALGRELAETAEGLRAQAHADGEAAVRAARERVIDEL